MQGRRRTGARWFALATIPLGLAMSAVGCNGDDDAAGDVRPPTALTIEVRHPDHPTLRYQIACNGVDTPALTGDEVNLDAAVACATLNDPAVIDRLVLGPDPDRMCTQVYGGPDEAAFTGTVDEMQVDAQVNRTDGCGIDEWDELLSDLLPRPR